MAKVLVVEDNELNMKLFNDLLAILKCESIPTRTGSNALALCRQHMPDLILMDIQLDGISGIDLIREMREDEKLKAIPIVAISAYAMKHEETRILQSGCDQYLSKPMSIEDFFSIVRFYTERERV